MVYFNLKIHILRWNSAFIDYIWKRFLQCAWLWNRQRDLPQKCPTHILVLFDPIDLTLQDYLTHFQHIYILGKFQSAGILLHQKHYDPWLWGFSMVLANALTRYLPELGIGAGYQRGEHVFPLVFIHNGGSRGLEDTREMV